MREIREILRAARALAPHEPAALASIVDAEGSTYRGVGARMWVHSDGTVIGMLSGGCLEADIIDRARRVAERGAPELVRYDTTEDHDALLGTGLGCRGIVDILIEPISHAALGPIPWLEAARSARAPTALATCVSGARLGERHGLMPGMHRAEPPAGADLTEALAEAARSGAPMRREIGGVVWAFELIASPLRLVVLGAGPDAPALVRAASALGWDVSVADHRAAELRPERFPDARVLHARSDEACKRLDVDASTHVVVMTHNLNQDRVLLRALFETEAPYIGLLGSRRRTRELLAGLVADGLALTEERLARLFSPAGLDLGGEGPDAIALSIVAEILARSEGRIEPRRPRLEIDEPNP